MNQKHQEEFIQKSKKTKHLGINQKLIRKKQKSLKLNGDFIEKEG